MKISARNKLGGLRGDNVIYTTFLPSITPFTVLAK